MKTLDENFKNSIINKSIITLNQCLKIKLKNGKVFGFTNYHKPIKFINDIDDVLYKSKGFVESVYQSNVEFVVSNINFDLFFDEDFTPDLLEKNMLNDAEVTYFEFNFLLKPFNYNQIDNINFGNLGSITKIGNLKYNVDFLSKINKYKQIITENITAYCKNDFCDENCGLDINDYQKIITITQISENRKEMFIDQNEVENFYKYGEILFLTGDSKNERHKIISSIDNKIKFQTSIVSTYNINDQFLLKRGCAKNFTACKSFNNYKNFNGFPFVPGRDFGTTSYSQIE